MISPTNERSCVETRLGIETTRDPLGTLLVGEEALHSLRSENVAPVGLATKEPKRRFA
jgi:hypothetical protein